MNEFLKKLFGLGGPFVEAFSQQLVSETAPTVKGAGKEAALWIKSKLLGTATTADDTLILQNLRALAEGLIEGIDETPPSA